MQPSYVLMPLVVPTISYHLPASTSRYTPLYNSRPPNAAPTASTTHCEPLSDPAALVGVELAELAVTVTVSSCEARATEVEEGAAVASAEGEEEPSVGVVDGPGVEPVESDGDEEDAAPPSLKLASADVALAAAPSTVVTPPTT